MYIYNNKYICNAYTCIYILANSDLMCTHVFMCYHYVDKYEHIILSFISSQKNKTPHLILFSPKNM